MDRTYLCIDLKSYYASVECVERGLDPMTTDLVVADPGRGERTICLAVSPSLKAKGVPGRCRVFEIPEGLSYIKAPPRMQLYMEYSARIFGIYLRYVAEEDIHIYSIDEAFMDITNYMGFWEATPEQFAKMLMDAVLTETGIYATCGVGSNLYLAKIAMDIIAKHTEERIGILTEESYRAKLWEHLPLTDFWRVSRGTVNRLEHLGLYTMRDIARADERSLYKAFGVDAQLLIDHAWGRETATMADIKAYRPREQSLSTAQVLHEGYDIPGAKLLVMEMAELLSLDLVAKGLSTSSISIWLAYSHTADLKPAGGTISTEVPTSSTRKILDCVSALYDKIAVWDVPVYHLGVCFNHVRQELSWQYDIFSAPRDQEREKSLQRTILDIKKKYGRNGIIKGMNLLQGAKTVERNAQIGGHRAI